ncbi:MAG: leucine-rich repeat protein [Oscillospiraceae bacterium]|nr:leucine-rich repeat protein [Oscillospiraceae bacterium]
MKKLKTALIAAIFALTAPGVFHIVNPDTVFAETLGDFAYTVSGDEVTVTDYIGNDTDIAVPYEIEGLPVTGIGESAFENCISVESIKIPNRIAYIGDFAFWRTSLNDVEIPDSVTYIGYAAFVYSKNLTSINVSENNSVYSSIGGVLFNKNQTELICYPNGKTGEYTVPNGVTDIGDGAFLYCESLTGIELPDGITDIGDLAFSDCTGLEDITIPNGLTGIGTSAFDNCTSLASVGIPDSVASIGVSAFHNCTELTYAEIPGNVTDIADFLFYDCKNLESVKVADSVKSIGTGAFSDCISLKSLEIPNSVSDIGLSAFENCTDLTFIKIGDGIKYIGDLAFLNCTALTGITLPDGILGIGKYAFADCISLADIEIPYTVTDIGSYAFFGCPNLIKVTVWSSVSGIEDETFGYYYSYDMLATVKTDGFTICGYADAFSKNYAAGNELEFISLGNMPILGDADGIDSVTIADAVVIARLLLDEPVQINKSAADIDRDGKITVKDLLKVVLFVGGNSVAISVDF